MGVASNDAFFGLARKELSSASFVLITDIKFRSYVTVVHTWRTKMVVQKLRGLHLPPPNRAVKKETTIQSESVTAR